MNYHDSDRELGQQAIEEGGTPITSPRTRREIVGGLAIFLTGYGLSKLPFNLGNNQPRSRRQPNVLNPAEVTKRLNEMVGDTAADLGMRINAESLSGKFDEGGRTPQGTEVDIVHADTVFTNHPTGVYTLNVEGQFSDQGEVDGRSITRVAIYATADVDEFHPNQRPINGFSDIVGAWAFSRKPNGSWQVQFAHRTADQMLETFAYDADRPDLFNIEHVDAITQQAQRTVGQVADPSNRIISDF